MNGYFPNSNHACAMNVLGHFLQATSSQSQLQYGDDNYLSSRTVLKDSIVCTFVHPMCVNAKYYCLWHQ